MPSVNQVAAAIRALGARFVGGVSSEEFDRRLATLDDGIADVRRELEDVRSLVAEFAGVEPVSREERSA